MKEPQGSGAYAEATHAFFSAVVAGVSHEVNNVLATVGQLSGLLGDLALATPNVAPLDPERIGDIVQRLNLQVDRGQRQTKQLNRFAHSLDPGWGEFDASELISQTLVLCERMARLRQIELESVGGAQALQVHQDPFQLRHLVWRCVDVALASVASQARVRFAATLAEGTLEFEVGSTSLVPPASDTSHRLAWLEAVVQHLGGHLRVLPREGLPMQLNVAVPARPSASHNQ